MKALLELSEAKELTAAKTTEWQKALTQFIEKYGTQFDLANTWTAEEKTKLLTTLMNYFRAGAWPVSLLVPVFTTIKVITRSRSSLETLYSTENVKALFAFVGRDDVPAPVRVEGLRVLLNMVIINEAGVTTELLKDGGSLGVLVRLLQQSDHDCRFVASRLLFFFAINDACTADLAKCEILKVASSVVVREADAEEKFVKFCEITPQGNQRRQIVSSCLKVLFNFLMDAKRPRLEATISAADFDTFGKCLCGLMQLGVTTKEPWERGNNQVEVVHPPAEGETKEQTPQSTGRYKLKFEASQMATDPNTTTQLEVQLDIANLLMYLPRHMVQFATDWKPLQGLATLLDYQAYASTLVAKTAREQLLVPILSTLTGVVKESPDAKLYFKRYIFGNLYKAADDQDKSAENLGMESEGPKLDTEVGTLREILLRCIISLQMTLKMVVSEFLYELCDQDTHEYIRLTGFGNAVGLLAEKGLPGFAGLKQQAHNLEDVLKSGKKL